MKVLCFDIGGTNIKYGVIEDAKILEKGSFPTLFRNGAEDVTKRLVEKAHELNDKFNQEIVGVGISCTGSIDSDNGVMLTPPENIQQFKSLNFNKIFKDEFGWEVFADNDVNSFAAAECMLGAGKKYNTYIVITIGTGIGGAIVVDNKVWRGNNYNAGEVGRMWINGVHWENLCSITALIRNAKLRGLDVENGKQVFDLYDEGNEIARIVVSEFYQNIGRGIANLIYIFNPEAVVVGGAISTREDFGKEMNAYADYYLVEGFQDTLDIIPATYRNDGGILGAYCNYVTRFGNK